MDTDTTYFWMCAVCFVAFIYLDVEDYSVLLKRLDKKFLKKLYGEKMEFIITFALKMRKVMF